MGVPVKRRQATLASDLPRNNRPELIADDGQGMFFPACPIPWHRPDRKAGRGPGVKDVTTHRTDELPPCLANVCEGALSFSLNHTDLFRMAGSMHNPIMGQRQPIAAPTAMAQGRPTGGATRLQARNGFENYIGPIDSVMP